MVYNEFIRTSLFIIFWLQVLLWKRIRKRFLGGLRPGRRTGKKDPEWRFLEEQINHALDRYDKIEGLQDRLITPIDKQYVLFMKKIYEVMHQYAAAATQKATLPHIENKNVKH